MALPDHKKQFLQAVGFQTDEIAAVEEVMANKAKSAQGEGLRSKEAPAVPAQAQEPQPQQQPVDVDAQLVKAQELLSKALEPFLVPLNARLTAIEADLTQFKQQGESLTPAASALAAKSIIQQPGDHLIKGRSDQGPKENNADKDAQQQVQAVTGVPFLDNLLALNDQHSNKRFQVGG